MFVFQYYSRKVGIYHKELSGFEKIKGGVDSGKIPLQEKRLRWRKVGIGVILILLKMEE